MTPLPAGRELDALVAEKVFGGADKCGFCCPSCDGSHFGTQQHDDGTLTRRCHDEFGSRCSWKGQASEAPPRFSTEIGDAWSIVDEMGAQRFGVIMNTTHAGEDAPFRCRFWQMYWSIDRWIAMPDSALTAWEPTAPLAICRAALAALAAVAP